MGLYNTKILIFWNGFCFSWVQVSIFTFLGLRVMKLVWIIKTTSLILSNFWGYSLFVYISVTILQKMWMKNDVLFCILKWLNTQNWWECRLSGWQVRKFFVCYIAICPWLFENLKFWIALNKTSWVRERQRHKYFRISFVLTEFRFQFVSFWD